MNLDEAERNVRRAINALELAGQEVAIKQKLLEVAYEEESRRDAVLQIANDERDAIWAEMFEPEKCQASE